MAANKKLTTNLLVKIDKQTWYDFRIIAETAGLTKDQAFEIALSKYIQENKKMDNKELMEAL